MKKKTCLFGGIALASISIATLSFILNRNVQSLVKANDGAYWNHYAQVTPTLTTHGSKEFWANCSTHNFTLENPGVGEDIREGVAFNTTTYFTELDSSDPRYLPPLNERVNIKGYLQSLLEAFTHDPYSFIPNTMRPEGAYKYTEASLTYDFTNFTNVSDIKYGGYGEQWHMVIENIKESERFYKVTTYGSEIIGASNLLVYAFLDDYYDGTVTKTFNTDARFTSKLDFNGTTLTYNIQFISSIDIPYFGTLTPQIDMEYVVGSNTKTVRIQLSENNALKFIIEPDTYTFGLEYGIETVSRKAYFTISQDENDDVEGHIYEFVQYKDKDLVPACADFYIGEDYTSVVGNKARAIIGFTGYINELYLTGQGKLLGYEIREKFSALTYNTLWFNLNNISGINNVKIADDKIYVNNSADEFATKKFGGVSGKTLSRRFDIEKRYQYFYDVVNEELEEYETSIPMMFVQEEKLSDFASDIAEVNTYLSASINLANAYLTKIQDDYDSLIDVFIDNKDDIDSAYIVDYIGDAEVI